jgi:hypothetical protein
MTGEHIYDALTGIYEDFIVEAETHTFKKARYTLIRWYAAAASLILIVGIGSFIFLNSGKLTVPGGSTSGGGVNGDSRHADGSTIFRSYAGPVFPMVIYNATADITATREIIFDFTGFGDTSSGTGQYSDIQITDRYTFTNNTGIDKNIQMFYPFAGNFSELGRLLPVITAWGVPLETTLMAGPYSGGFSGGDMNGEYLAVNLSVISVWDEYAAILSDGEYLRHATSVLKELNQTVTVYEFSNVQADRSIGEAPTLAAIFDLDYAQTEVMTYRFNGGQWDYENGMMRRSFFVPEEWFPGNDRHYYMIVTGGEINNLVIQGYKNGGCHKGQEMDITADMKRYEARLSDILELLLTDFMDIYDRERAEEPAYTVLKLDKAMLYKASAELLGDFGMLSDQTAFRYITGEITDIFSETLVMNRVFYLNANVTIPAQGDFALNVTQTKPGSYDFYGSGSPNINGYGYDMLTRLGTGLTLSETTAGISGTDNITIVRQNFGFDPEESITHVILDPEVLHYYIEVRGDD